MKADSPLKNKHILVVDDEPDVLEFVEEELDMSLVDKASDYETALQYLQNYTYDIVILDIDLPGRPATDLLVEAHHICNRSKIILLGGGTKLKQLAGKDAADDYVVKGGPPEQLLRAFRQTRKQSQPELNQVTSEKE